MSDRPKVGMADPATVRRKIAEHMTSAKQQAHAGLYRGSGGAQQSAPTTSFSAFNAAAKLKRRGRQIDRAVDEAQGHRLAIAERMR